MKVYKSLEKMDQKHPYCYNYYESASKFKIMLKKYFPKIRERYLIYKYSQECKEDINAFMKNPQIFQAVEIETVNRCNGTCEFCPVNKNDEKRPFHIMEDTLFEKIIKELKGISKMLEADGKQLFIALHSNNEPFIDQRMEKFIKYAKENIPNAFLYLYTNGTLLKTDMFERILQYLDRIDIDNYSDELEILPDLEHLYKYCIEHNVEHDKVKFHIRKEHEVLTTRGGQAPNKKKVKTIKSQCYLPYVQFIIRPDGKVSLCCNDALGTYTMGNANNQTLMEIWESKEYEEIRSSMYKEGRKNLDLCKECDTCHNLSF